MKWNVTWDFYFKYFYFDLDERQKLHFLLYRYYLFYFIFLKKIHWSKYKNSFFSGEFLTRLCIGSFLCLLFMVPSILDAHLQQKHRQCSVCSWWSSQPKQGSCRHNLEFSFFHYTGGRSNLSRSCTLCSHWC